VSLTLRREKSVEGKHQLLEVAESYARSRLSSLCAVPVSSGLVVAGGSPSFWLGRTSSGS